MEMPLQKSNNLSLSTNFDDAYAAYRERARACENEAARRLLEIMACKQTNLAVAADVTSKRALLELAEQIGPYICILKTHIDIIEDFDFDLIDQLRNLAQKHLFLIFEDRKFADIGNTVKHQYEGGIYRIAEWADLVTMHALPGPGIIEGIASSAAQYGAGIVLLPSMSSAGNLITPEYTQATLSYAHRYKKSVAGLIVRDPMHAGAGFISMMPGVQMSNAGDGLGQQYVSPQVAIEQGADVIIVGRGIYGAKDSVKAAQMYRDAARQAYQEKYARR